jgi:hypothetical protein
MPTLVSLLKKISVVHGLLSTTIAAVSPTLIRSFLIPEQLSIIGAVGSLFVFMGLLIFGAYREKVIKHLQLWVVIALSALILLVVFHIFFVKTLDNYGDPPATHRFLVGFNMNDEGKSSMSIIGSSSIEELIRADGWQRIPTWYGVDWYIVELLYVSSYILFILGVVLSLGGISSPPNRGKRNANKSSQRIMEKPSNKASEL